MKLPHYFEDPQILHIGTEATRSYYMPYKQIAGDRCKLLSGDDWKFQWFKTYLDVDAEFVIGACKGFDTIAVPSTVNALGYDKHQYANLKLPIPFDPPYVPFENPCGAYVKTFEMDAIQETYYLNFEGVDSCFYLWLNGQFVGYSQVSHATAEFCITNFLKLGTNTMSVLALKWCDGTYFEDQDKFRMTGIFRDVYILERAKEHIVDFKVKSILQGDDANIQIDILRKIGLEYAISIQLKAPCGTVIHAGTLSESSTTIHVKKPLLWNAEQPYLYTLIFSYCGEHIMQKVGIRQIEIKDSILSLNGQNIKLKGTNRHDSDAVTGCVISKEHLLKDLQLMKAHNINAIRTSHYPNAPWAYDLFSEHGFYIINEADIETHNTEHLYGGGRVGYDYKKDLFTSKTFGLLCSDPTYEKTILDRIEQCVNRDKNHACVIMWSLGNESGYGVNMEHAAAWIKVQDPDYLVHYESSIYQMPDHVNDLSNLDVYSRMYMPVDDCALYCKSNPQKPLFLCEFIASLGNAPGDIEDYFEAMYEYDTFSGGFIWEWNDHAVYAGLTVDGKAKYLYGGDFGEFPNDNNFCVDGMLTPERQPHTGLIEYANVARPIRATYLDGKILLYNTMDFSNVKDTLEIQWTFYKDFEIAAHGLITGFDLAPHEKKELTLPCAMDAQESDASILLQFLTKEGQCLGFDQILLQKSVPSHPCTTKDQFQVTETDKTYEIEHGTGKYTFGKYTGTISSICYHNTAYFSKPCEYNIWRAPIDNDRKIGGEWYNAGYDRCLIKVYDSHYNIFEDKVVVHFTLGFGAQFIQNFLTAEAIWTVYADGTLDIDIQAKRNMIFPYLPRFGIRMFLAKEYETVQYIGYGPYESYEDKHRASYYGKFNDTVKNMHVDYLVPQENGSHFNCTKLALSNGQNCIQVFGEHFSFNVSHYTQEHLQKTKHNFELIESNDTILCIDSKMSGIGSSACGPFLIKKYRLEEEHIPLNLQLKLL